MTHISLTLVIATLHRSKCEMILGPFKLTNHELAGAIFKEQRDASKTILARAGQRNREACKWVLHVEGAPARVECWVKMFFSCRPF